MMQIGFDNRLLNYLFFGLHNYYVIMCQSKIYKIHWFNSITYRYDMTRALTLEKEKLIAI